MNRRILTLTWNTASTTLAITPSTAELMREEPFRLLLVTDVDLADAPAVTATLKADGDFDGDPLWSFTGGLTRVAPCKWYADVLLSSSAINTLLAVNEDPTDDVKTANVVLQLRLAESDVVTAKSAWLPLTLKNDYSRPADLTPQAQPSPEDWLGARAVRFDVAQTLTDDQKTQARANIGAGTGTGGVTTFAALTDKTSADLPSINTALAASLGAKASSAALASEASARSAADAALSASISALMNRGPIVRIAATNGDYTNLAAAVADGKFYCALEPGSTPGDVTLPINSTLVLFGYGSAVSQTGTISCLGNATVIGNGKALVNVAGGVQAPGEDGIALYNLTANYAEAVGLNGSGAGESGGTAGTVIAEDCNFTDTIYLYGGNGGPGTSPATAATATFTFNNMGSGYITLDGRTQGVTIDGDGNPIWPDFSVFGWNLKSSDSASATYTYNDTSTGHSGSTLDASYTLSAFADGVAAQGGGTAGSGGNMTINRCTLANAPSLIGGVGTDGAPNGPAGTIAGNFNVLPAPDSFSGGALTASVITGNFYSSYD